MYLILNTFMIAKHLHARLSVWVIGRLEAQLSNSYTKHIQILTYAATLINLLNITPVLANLTLCNDDNFSLQL